MGPKCHVRWHNFHFKRMLITGLGQQTFSQIEVCLMRLSNMYFYSTNILQKMVVCNKSNGIKCHLENFLFLKQFIIENLFNSIQNINYCYIMTNLFLLLAQSAKILLMPKLQNNYGAIKLFFFNIGLFSIAPRIVISLLIFFLFLVIVLCFFLIPLSKFISFPMKALNLQLFFNLRGNS